VQSRSDWPPPRTRGRGAGGLLRFQSVPIKLICECELWKCGGGEVRALGDDYLAWGFLPLAVVVDVAVEADGADDGRGGDRDAMGLFEDGFEDDAEIAAAELIQAEGADVAVESFVIVETVFADDGCGAGPVDEIVFDESAVGMMADGAFAGVAFAVGCRGQSGRGGVGNRSWLGKASLAHG
jgi:hypothetical protein